MRVVVQRVTHASCTVDNKITGEINQGYLLLVGFCPLDTYEIVDKLAKKITGLRVFSDEAGKMNLSLKDVNGSILSISQFTLYADASKGNRPSFTNAMKGELATVYYDYFNQKLRELGNHVECGIFGADMKIDLINDGPVTIIYDEV